MHQDTKVCRTEEAVISLSPAQKRQPHVIVPVILVAAVMMLAGVALSPFAASEESEDDMPEIRGEVAFANFFGGSGTDFFYTVTATSDGGFVAAGYSAAASFGNGDWTDVTGHGNTDAIIVKFDIDGNIVWKKHFGGSNTDYFYAVTATPDGGFVAVGASGSFGNGDWTGVTGRGNQDATIVKFDADGNIVWKKNFGGSALDRFNAVTATPDGGFVAAGTSEAASFGNGDWVGVTGRGNNDAIIVKFDNDGNTIWKKNFGGSGDDHFKAVTATSDGGFVAAGYSSLPSFGNGDWTGVTGRGGSDAIIVKFDNDGNTIWMKHFGGSAPDYFNAVTATPDGGFVAAGYSSTDSFGNGDWIDVTGRGGQDAIIVKFDADGNVVWKKNFGGSDGDYFNAVTATPDGGFVAAGYSLPTSFGNGDWTDPKRFMARGGQDAIIVKFDADGNVIWKKHFGGSSADYFNAVTATTDGGFVVVGDSNTSSFGTGDWTGVTGRGSTDAIIVKYTEVVDENGGDGCDCAEPQDNETSLIAAGITIGGSVFATLSALALGTSRHPYALLCIGLGFILILTGVFIL